MSIPSKQTIASITGQKTDVFQDTGTGLTFTDWQLDDKGNVVAMGPVAREYSEFEMLLLVVLIVKLGKTPEGLKTLGSLANKYLESMTRIIEAMQGASKANFMNALINQYACLNIYERIGLITPFDKVHTQLWIDHVFGEVLKQSYVFEGLGSVTTLIEGSKYEAKEGAISTESIGSIAAMLRALK